MPLILFCFRIVHIDYLLILYYYILSIIDINIIRMNEWLTYYENLLVEKRCDISNDLHNDIHDTHNMDNVQVMMISWPRRNPC